MAELVIKSIAGTNAGTLAAAATADENFISEADQFYSPFTDSFFSNNSQSPNDVDLRITPNGDQRLSFVILAGQSIPTTIRFRYFNITNIHATNTLQVGAFEFTTKATREDRTVPRIL